MNRPKRNNYFLIIGNNIDDNIIVHKDAFEQITEYMNDIEKYCDEQEKSLDELRKAYMHKIDTIDYLNDKIERWKVAYKSYKNALSKACSKLEELDNSKTKIKWLQWSRYEK